MSLPASRGWSSGANPAGGTYTGVAGAGIGSPQPASPGTTAHHIHLLCHSTLQCHTTFIQAVDHISCVQLPSAQAWPPPPNCLPDRAPSPACPQLGTQLRTKCFSSFCGCARQMQWPRRCCVCVCVCVCVCLSVCVYLFLCVLSGCVYLFVCAWPQAWPPLSRPRS